MDVLPRPAGVIRVHRFSDPSLDDLHGMDMVDSPVRAFLHASILAGASPLVSGAPGVGKTTLLRALGNAIPWNNVVITVEDERELGLHLPRWDPERRQLVRRHAVCRPFESRLPNAEGRGGFDMGDALHLALRASPTWVLVGEVRGAYVAPGTTPGMSRAYPNSARAATPGGPTSSRSLRRAPRTGARRPRGRGCSASRWPSG